MMRQEYWHCKYFHRGVGGAEGCTINFYCLHGCDDFEDRRENLCLKCEGLSVDLKDKHPILCMYDDHYSETYEGLQEKCPKKMGYGIND